MKVNELSMLYRKQTRIIKIKNSVKVPKKIYKKKNSKNPLEIVKLLEYLYCFSMLTEEYSFIFAFKNKKLLGIYELSHGTENDCDMDLQIICKFLITINADSFSICHNHPNYNSRMSQDDYMRTIEIKKMAELLNVKFYDHIIVGKKEWRSANLDIQKMNEMNITDVSEYYKYIDKQKKGDYYARKIRDSIKN